MANLPVNDQEWQEGVYQIEKADPVLGGPDGITNLPLKQLASRTAYLKRMLAEIEQQIADLSYSDVNAAPKQHTHTTSQVTGLESALDRKVPTTRKVNGKSLSADISLSAADVGAATSSHGHAIANVTGLQTALDGKATSDHGHSDLVPVTRKVNGKALSKDVTLIASDIKAAESNHNHDTAYAQKNHSHDYYPKLPDLKSTDNLDNLWQAEHVGIRGNSTINNATSGNGYPVARSGTLLVTPVVGRGYSQIYITTAGEMFQRTILKTDPVTWSEWTQYASLNQANFFETYQRIRGSAINLLQIHHGDEETSSKAISFWKNELSKFSILVDYPYEDKTQARARFAHTGSGKSMYFEHDGRITIAGSEIATQNVTNVFTKGQKISSNGDAITIEIPEGTTTGYIRLKKSDGTLIGTIGKVGSKDSFMIGYGTLSKPLEFTADGKVLFAGEEIYHQGNRNAFFGSSLAESGWQKLPSGLIIQWGKGGWHKDEIIETVNFPIAFPTTCLTVIPGTNLGDDSNAADIVVQLSKFTKTQAKLRLNIINSALVGYTQATYVAIGY